MNKLERFMTGIYPAGSYFAVLQLFLQKKQKRVSQFTVARLYFNLQPIGEELNNPDIEQISREWLDDYIERCWLGYAPETMRTMIGDVRQFFRWCKKKKYTKNIAQGVKPVKRRQRRNRRVRPAPEADIKKLIEFLAKPLKQEVLLYRDVFQVLQPAAGWPDEAVRVLRDLLIVVFLYETGARVGELAKLGARVMDEATKRPRESYLITVIGKTDDRDRLFTERTAELWRVWQQVRPPLLREYAVIGWSYRNPPAPFDPHGISSMLMRRGKAAGIRPFRANALRHAKVRRSRQIVGLEITSRLIDHSTIGITQGYDYIDEIELSKAARDTGLISDIWA